MAKKGEPMKGARAAGAVVGTVIAGACMDPADRADLTDSNRAHASDSDLSALEAPSEPPENTGGTDSPANVAGEPVVAGAGGNAGSAGAEAPRGEVYLFLNACHAEDELTIRRQAADPAQQGVIPYRLENGGLAACIECELGRATRFVVDSSREGTLHCELKTTFERVGVQLDFAQESVYFEPVVEGEGLQEPP